MSSISRTSSGYVARFYFKSKRYSKSFSTKRECKDWIAHKTNELIKQSSSEEVPKSFNTVSLRNLFLRYFFEFLADNPKKRAEQFRVGKLLRDYPELVNKRVIDITKADIRDWIKKCSIEVSGASVRKYCSLLNIVFKTANNEWDLDLNNPLIGMKIPSENLPRERYIEDWEINTMLAKLGYEQAIALESIKLRVGAAFLFSLETAMRAGEICNLEWNDISESGLVLKVKTAKTRSGIREVPLSSKARKIIEQCKLENDSLKVFRIKSEQLDANFRKYRKEANLKGFTFHDARATAITRLAKKLDILDLAKMVGHKDPKMLMVYYRQGAEALAERLG